MPFALLFRRATTCIGETCYAELLLRLGIRSSWLSREDCYTALTIFKKGKISQVHHDTGVYGRALFGPEDGVLGYPAPSPEIQEMQVREDDIVRGWQLSRRMHSSERASFRDVFRLRPQRIGVCPSSESPTV